MKTALIVCIVLCLAEGTFAACPLGWSADRANCYKYFSEMKTYAEANLACVVEGAVLVKPLGDDENNIVKSLTVVDAWIGINDIKEEGQFVFLAFGESIAYSNWHNGEPNNQNNEDCVEINYGQNGHWNDRTCSDSLGYICQTPA